MCEYSVNRDRFAFHNLGGGRQLGFSNHSVSIGIVSCTVSYRACSSEWLKYARIRMSCDVSRQ